MRRMGWLWVAAVVLAPVYGCGDDAPRCDGDELVRPCTERECVEGGYTEGDGLVHQACAGACVEANGTAECVRSPLVPCTASVCDFGGVYVCGPTGYRAGVDPCFDRTSCVAGDGWAECAVPDVPCDAVGAWFCRDGDPYRCGEHGLAVEASEVCDGEHACVETAGMAFCALRDVTCPPDAYAICHQQQVVTCAQQTTYALSRAACDAGLACVELVIEGQPTAQCR